MPLWLDRAVLIASSLTTREDYAAFYQDDRKYISFASFYGEFAKPWNERRIGVYRRWKERNS